MSFVSLWVSRMRQDLANHGVFAGLTQAREFNARGQANVDEEEYR